MFKLHFRLFVLLCLPAIPLISETQALESPGQAAPVVNPQIADKAVTLEKYSNAEKHYSIEYPSDWKKSDVPQLDIVLFAPSKGDDQSPRASVNVVSENVGATIPLDTFFNESINNLKESLKDVNVEKTGSIELNGTQSKWIIYTHTMQNVKFRVIQYFVVANQTVYLITFGALDQDFEGYKGDFDKIVSTFRVTK